MYYINPMIRRRPVSVYGINNRFDEREGNLLRPFEEVKKEERIDDATNAVPDSLNNPEAEVFRNEKDESQTRIGGSGLLTIVILIVLVLLLSGLFKY